MKNLIDLVKDNRSISMESGRVFLTNVQGKISAKGNPYIALTFKESGTDDDERRGCDDAIVTTNITEFEQSFKRIAYVFISTGKLNVLESKCTDMGFYDIIKDQTLTLGSQELFDEAVEKKMNKTVLLKQVCDEEASKLEELLKSKVSYTYEYDSKNKTYNIQFYAIDESALKKTMHNILTALQEVVNNELYVHIENEQVPGRPHLTNCKVVKYQAV